MADRMQVLIEKQQEAIRQQRAANRLFEARMTFAAMQFREAKVWRQRNDEQIKQVLAKAGS